MPDLIDNLDIVVRVLTEDGYPSEYASSVVTAIHLLEQQADRIKELEGFSAVDDADCYCD